MLWKIHVTCIEGLFVSMAGEMHQIWMLLLCAAFGGVNVDPSVRSCFEQAGDKGFIEVLGGG